MIVDSSALVEIALGKAGAEALMVALARPEPKRISAGNLLETWMVVDRRGIPEAAVVLDDTIRRAALIVEPVTEAQVAIARDAWRRYGRGSGHPARLNYGTAIASPTRWHRSEASRCSSSGTIPPRPTSPRRWIRIPGPSKSARPRPWRRYG